MSAERSPEAVILAALGIHVTDELLQDAPDRRAAFRDLLRTLPKPSKRKEPEA